MAGKRKSSTKSATPMSATEQSSNAPADGDSSLVMSEEYEVMNKVWTYIHDYKDERQVSYFDSQQNIRPRAICYFYHHPPFLLKEES
jgi:hypothetical protein